LAVGAWQPPLAGPRFDYRRQFVAAYRPAATRIAQYIARSPHIHRLGPVQVFVYGDTARLVGRVASADDSRIAALVASLEPGIRRVENHLEVR
jgi:osmotically-inducible protein OsmY